jgi:dephospho-CoA kinase
MLRVGLTGSIGVGKSFVATELAHFGCHVLDADQTARSVVELGSEGLRKVVEEFGLDILRADGTLDRSKLGAIVFADEKKRERLNAILHPYIIAEQDRQLQEWEKQNPNSIAVVDAALMIESGGYKRFDKLIVVHCNPEVQLERLMLRDGLTRAQAEKRIATQMPQDQKMKFADYLIDTSGDFADVSSRTAEVYSELCVALQRGKG